MMENNLKIHIEALLFAVGKPVSVKKLSNVFRIPSEQVLEFIDELMQERNNDSSGIHFVKTDTHISLISHPSSAEFIAKMVKTENQAELTSPQLETLTVIAYRGPITKAELEHIRGVNCSIIIRNLLMRGLILEKTDADKIANVYTISQEFLAYLGIHSMEELPDYKEFHENKKIDEMLEVLTEEIES